MKNKRLKIIIVILVVGVILFLIYKLLTFKLYDVQENTLAKIKIEGCDYYLKISTTNTGATTSNYLDIKKVYNGGKEELLMTYKNYNYIEKYKILDDSTILLVLKDTMYYANQPDTFRIRIK